MKIPHVKILHKTLIVTIGLLFYPSYALAHLVTTGLGPVYDGIGHLVMTWAKIVVRVAGSWVAAMGMLMFGWLMR